MAVSEADAEDEGEVDKGETEDDADDEATPDAPVKLPWAVVDVIITVCRVAAVPPTTLENTLSTIPVLVAVLLASS